MVSAVFSNFYLIFREFQINELYCYTYFLNLIADAPKFGVFI